MLVTAPTVRRILVRQSWVGFPEESKRLTHAGQGLDLRDGGGNDEAHGPEEDDHDGPGYSAFEGEKWRAVEHIFNHVDVEDFQAFARDQVSCVVVCDSPQEINFLGTGRLTDVTVEATRDDARYEGQDVADCLPGVVAHALEGDGERVLALEGIDVEPICNEVSNISTSF